MRKILVIVLGGYLCSGLQGQRTDAVTYVMFLLSTELENLEDDRQLKSGTALVDFRVERGERIDSMLSRFGTARIEADSAGFNAPNFQTLTLLLFRSLQIGPQRA